MVHHVNGEATSARANGTRAMAGTLTVEEHVANLLLDTRRERGISVSALAADALVPERVIEDAESGRGMSQEAALAVLPLLGIDPAPLVDLPRGPVPVPPTDRDHARTMAYLARVADVGDGWLLHPDVVAMGPLDDCTEADVRRTRDVSARFWAKPTTTWQRLASPVMGILLGFGILVGLFGLLALLVAGATAMEGGSEWASDLEFAGWLLCVCAACGLGFYALWWGYPRDGSERDQAHRLMVERHERARTMRETAARGVRSGYVVSDDGIVAHVTGGDGLERREYHSSAFRSVDVRDEDATHVTVVVDSVVGQVTMPWLQRSRSLTDLVTRWRTGCDAGPEDGLQ